MGELGLGMRPAQEVKGVKYEALRDSYVEENRGRSYTSTVANIKHLDSYFAGMSVLDITADTIRDFTKTKRKELADPTIRRILGTFRAMFNQAKKEGKIRHVDVPYFPMPADSKPRKGFLTPEQFAKLMEHIPAHLQPVITFSYLTGCRIGATKKILWSMVSEDCSEIELSGEITKSGGPLTLPLVGELAEISKSLKKMFRDESKPVFDVRNLRYLWYEACSAAGFGSYHKKKRVYRGLELHDLRRSAVRNLIRAGVDRGTAMSISGHKTEHVFERYNITSTEDRKAALLRVTQYNAKEVKEAKNSKEKTA